MIVKTSSTETPGWPGPRIDHTDFAARLAVRRAELGDPGMPRNGGNNRTASKKALLAAIEAAGGKW